jgi:hypothetical protein
LLLPPEQCVYVGDDERDIVAGRAAGMRTVAATYGYLGGGPTWPPGARCQHFDTLGLAGPLESAPTGLKYGFLGLHWFRRGFGHAAGHVEVQSPRKSAEKN